MTSKTLHEGNVLVLPIIFPKHIFKIGHVQNGNFKSLNLGSNSAVWLVNMYLQWDGLYKIENVLFP